MYSTLRLYCSSFYLTIRLYIFFLNLKVSELSIPVKKRVLLEGAELDEFYRRSRQPSLEKGDGHQAEEGAERGARKRRRLSARREEDADAEDESDTSSSSDESESSDEQQEAETPLPSAVEFTVRDANAPTQQQSESATRAHRPMRLSSITGTAQLPFDLPAVSAHIPVARADAVFTRLTSSNYSAIYLLLDIDIEEFCLQHYCLYSYA